MKDVTGRTVLSFAVAGREFNIPAAEIAEIRRTPRLTRVPNGPVSLAGLMNYNGSAIAVIRMASLLDLPRASSAASTDARVVIYGQSPPVALLVDQVLGIKVESAGRKKTKVVDVQSLLGERFVAATTQRVRLEHPPTIEAVFTHADDSVALFAFRIAGQRYALPLTAIVEVLVLPEHFSAFPRGADSALGMFEHRDTIVPLVSAAKLLGLSDDGLRHHVLIAFIGTAMVGLVVGAVDGVVRLSQGAIDSVPEVLQRGDGDAEIDGIARAGDATSLISILSTAKLFQNREIFRTIDQAQTKATAMPQREGASAELQFVVFQLGEETYGLPILAVEEIAQLPEKVTRVPRSPRFVAGAMNMRGKALPLIDLRIRFASASDVNRGRVLVVTMGELRAGFIVDAVSEILRVPATSVEPSPQLPGEAAKVFDRVTTSDGGIVLVVDPQELLDRAERDLLKRFMPAEGVAAIS